MLKLELDYKIILKHLENVCIKLEITVRKIKEHWSPSPLVKMKSDGAELYFRKSCKTVHPHHYATAHVLVVCNALCEFEFQLAALHKTLSC